MAPYYLLILPPGLNPENMVLWKGWKETPGGLDDPCYVLLPWKKFKTTS